jgi:hypothetical protein
LALIIHPHPHPPGQTGTSASRQFPAKQATRRAGSCLPSRLLGEQAVACQAGYSASRQLPSPSSLRAFWEAFSALPSSQLGEEPARRVVSCLLGKQAALQAEVARRAGSYLPSRQLAQQAAACQAGSLPSRQPRAKQAACPEGSYLLAEAQTCVYGQVTADEPGYLPLFYGVLDTRTRTRTRPRVPVQLRRVPAGG